jgi:hypothetical protein
MIHLSPKVYQPAIVASAGEIAIALPQATNSSCSRDSDTALEHSTGLRAARDPEGHGTAAVSSDAELGSSAIDRNTRRVGLMNMLPRICVFSFRYARISRTQLRTTQALQRGRIQATPASTDAIEYEVAQ